jgi:hypothetical protein
MGLEANWVLRHWCYGMCRRLVHRAESLREMTKKLVHHSPRPAPYTPRTLVHDEGKLLTRLIITHTPHALYPTLWRKKPQIPSPIHPQFLMMIIFFNDGFLVLTVLQAQLSKSMSMISFHYLLARLWKLGEVMMPQTWK